MNRAGIVLLLVVPFTLARAPTHAPVYAAEGKADVPLAEALEEWVGLLEKGDVKAAGRWARDADAAEAVAGRWAQLRQCHEDHDYRTWLDRDPATGGPGARQIGDVSKFTVGGHSFGHHHVDWAKGAHGWRIVDVRICR